MAHWNRLLTALGLVLVALAGGSIGYTLLSNGDQPEVALVEVTIDAVLIGAPGLAMMYTAAWLPTTAIPPELYSRIVAWTGGGIAIMAVVVGLRELHPAVELDLTGGTQTILLSISSITGLLIGVQSARTKAQSQALERQNRELQQKYELEKQNEQLRRTEQRLEEAVTELEASNERLEEFAYAVSHDLQEPLRMVRSYVRLLERRYGDELDDDGQEFVDYAVDGAERMGTMIDGLLAYSRIQTQGESFEPVDLEVVLEDVRTDLQLKIEEHDAEIESESLPTVTGDESQLRQVFQNLLSNAIEYSGDEPPRVRITAERDGGDGDEGAWTIAVSDEGIGMEPADTERIFEIFQRLETADDRSGSGIGLAVCKRIVERHGGEIRVETAPGEGSTFFVTLPDADHPAAISPVESEPLQTR
ncbi:sensor histidine kinase [Natronolimnohabitans innermongolicus]|uniref:histidine kinase n=1 Tax=Natronolimnohabitans innermongolicus JCM 12255 TaxID=1227499 RepID=L9X4P5_9EURY|nr:ATP-binding protein [Natronolimnohabitans innermongolicus]ELY55543.1 integral membrane sensor signal transduction histidine kinase [Natronolimnohabitans innermongolicus JCM 12255]